MKKKVLTAITLAAVLAAGLGAAAAAPGTNDDPFVTRSYLTSVYYAQAEQAMLKQAQDASAKTGQAAEDRLDKLMSGYLPQAGGGEFSGSFLRITLSRGDRLEVPAGSSLLFEAGQGELTFASGTLVDVTGGGTVADGGKLTAGRHYVAAEDAACTFTAATDAAILSVRGSYTLERAGAVQTPFTDLTDTDWYYPYVRFAYEKGLFQGISATVFSPDANMNRAMLATVLYRLAGARETAYGAGFTDVDGGAWYADAVNWAAGAGVVTGGEGGAFLPDSDVTREQMALMLYRYAKDYSGLNVSAFADLSGFPDRAKISPWAEEALSWAVGAGIITGYENGGLGPADTATRAEVATMLQRFSEFLV